MVCGWGLLCVSASRSGACNQVGRCPGFVLSSPSSSCSSRCRTLSRDRDSTEQTETRVPRTLEWTGVELQPWSVLFSSKPWLLQGSFAHLLSGPISFQPTGQKAWSWLLWSWPRGCVQRGEGKLKLWSLVSACLQLQTLCATSAWLFLPLWLRRQEDSHLWTRICAQHTACWQIEWRLGLGQAVVNLDQGNNGVDPITVKIAFVVGLRKILRYCQWHDVLSKISFQISVSWFSQSSL